MRSFGNGLEVSVVRLSEVLSGARTLRIDPEYFQNQHISDSRSILEKAGQFSSASSLGVTVDASAFYPSIERYYGSGDLPFYRVGDVDGMIDHGQSIRIPEEVVQQFPTLKVVNPGDIVFTKGGAVDRVGYVKHRGAVSRDLIFLNTSHLPEQVRLTLFAYFRTSLFRRMLVRSSSQTAQPHLTITLVRDLPLFVGTSRLEAKIAESVIHAYELFEDAQKRADKSEKVLLESLGLSSWSPEDPRCYVSNASVAISAKRLDPQYFRPVFEEVKERIQSTGRSVLLGDILSVNARGSQPVYTSVGGLPVVNSKHVRQNRVILKGNRMALKDDASTIIENGDVLVNGTGVGTIGRAAPYLHSKSAIPDNHVTVIRTSNVDPIYLSSFLNSPLGQLQIERYIKGSSGQIEVYPKDLSKIVVWDAPKSIQNNIRDGVLEAFSIEKKARRLFEASREAVEIAIQYDEGRALSFLKNLGG